MFRAFSPWRAIRLPGIRAYPERWGRYPAAIALLGFTWIELVSGWGEDPGALTTAAVVYTVYTIAMQAVFGTETLDPRGEAFAVYFNLFSPHLDLGDARPRRRPAAAARRPAAARRAPGTVLFVVVMIGTVTFDGFSQGAALEGHRRSTSPTRSTGSSGSTPRPRSSRRSGCCSASRSSAASTGSGSTARARSAATSTRGELRRAFIHTLVPIAMVYVAAHYLTFLLFEGQATFYLASDPLGEGWDLFGTADRAINYTYLSQNATWYLQVAVVVVGHVAALILAHDRALALYRDPKLAVRSQYWMLAVMVGFTSLALWLLAQAAA